MSADRPGEGPDGWRADAELLLLTLIWGLNYNVVKAGLGEIGPLAFNALRFPLAAVVLWWAMRRSGRIRLPDREDLPAVLALALVGHVLYQLLFIFGLDRTLAGNAAIILASAPAWTVVLSKLSGGGGAERITWVGAVVTLIGVALVVVGGPRGVAVGAATLPGDLLTLAAAIGWAAYTVQGRPLIQRYGALPVTAWGLWIATPLLVAVGLPSLAGLGLPAVSPAAWGAVAYAGALALGVAYLIWYRSVGQIGPERTAIYGNLVPLVTLVAAWAWRGLPPTATQLLGAAGVIAGVLLTRLSRPGS